MLTGSAFPMVARSAAAQLRGLTPAERATLRTDATPGLTYVRPYDVSPGPTRAVWWVERATDGIVPLMAIKED